MSLPETTRCGGKCVFAARSKDADILRKSASGGVFSELARRVLSDGGVVYGAGWNVEHCRVEYRGIESWDQIHDLQGSKYVRSRLGTAYAEVKRHLEQGRRVLFSGTPCQVNGLARYLGSPSDKLLLVDIICHGTPHPDVFEAYKAELKRKLGGDITSFSFRMKRESWMHGRLVVTTTGTSLDIPYGESPYIRAFVSGLSLCCDCFGCRAKGNNRLSDITIGDCWGIDKIAPDRFDDRGMSLVVVHTQRGEQVLSRCSDTLDTMPVQQSAVLAYNHAYNESARKPKGWSRFMQSYRTSDMDALVKRCRFGPVWRQWISAGVCRLKDMIRPVVHWGARA